MPNYYKAIILLATYNGEKFLGEQLESIFSQTARDFHLIIRDDGSTDKTCAILHEYLNRYPEQITLLTDEQQRIGASLSFGRLLEYAVADKRFLGAQYFTFCDQDDVWLPDRLKILMDRIIGIERDHADAPVLVHGDLMVVDEKLSKIDKSLWHYQGIDPERNTLNRLLLQNTVTGCATVVNRSLARLACPIPKDATMHDWWLALVAGAFGRIVAVKESLVLYRQHGANATGARHYDLRYVLRNARQVLSRSEFRRKLERHLRQAEAFCQRYSDRLSQDQIAMLNGFLDLRRLGFVGRRRVLLRHRFLVSGWLRNIAILLRI